MSRRVVVTGLGAVSPVGNDVPTMWKNLVDGVCGIEEITAFDTSELKVHIAGTVKDFEPEKYFEKRAPIPDPPFPPSNLDWHMDDIRRLEAGNKIVEAARKRQKEFAQKHPGHGAFD